MQKVTDETFFKVIGPLDVTLDVQGNYPYKTVFKKRRGEIVGYMEGGSSYLVDSYVPK